MRVLVTNDDGINAPGLKALEQIAHELAGDAGEVWVIAPTQERSGVAHCISYTSPMLINKIAERRFSVDGYPADCVLAGLYHIMPERPDVILSGVNRGNNSAENVLYSGTIGAALEGALQGIKSFALSQYLGPKNYDLADPFEASHVHGTDILRDLIAREYDNPSDYHIFFNINFPPVPAADVKGHKFAAQGLRQGSQFSAIMQTAPNNREFLYVKGGDQHVAVGDTSDAGVNLDGYVSITPMRADFTAYDILEQS